MEDQKMNRTGKLALLSGLMFLLYLLTRDLAPDFFPLPRIIGMTLFLGSLLLVVLQLKNSTWKIILTLAVGLLIAFHLVKIVGVSRWIWERT